MPCFFDDPLRRQQLSLLLTGSTQEEGGRTCKTDRDTETARASASDLVRCLSCIGILQQGAKANVRVAIIGKRYVVELVYLEVTRKRKTNLDGQEGQTDCTSVDNGLDIGLRNRRAEAQAAGANSETIGLCPESGCE